MHLFIFESNQAQDTPYTFLDGFSIKPMYGFYRSDESVQNGVDSQDYLIIKCTELTTYFVICDGVGQSFMGQIAAKYLAYRLWTWMEKELISGMGDHLSLAKKLFKYLNQKKIITSGQNNVSSYKLPAGLPELHTFALEEQRQYGSESVFLAGRIDLEQNNRKLTPRLHVFWLGDTEIHLFDQENQEMQIQDRRDQNQRWSTIHGVKGADFINSWAGTLEGVNKIIVHSDGLKVESSKLLPASSSIEKMTRLVAGLRSRPDSDDISVISITFNEALLSKESNNG
jgi:hypothetical protein